MASTPEYSRKRYLEKREHILNVNRLYRENNPDKKKAISKRWQDNNKPRRAANEAKRRSGKRMATPSWLTEEDHQAILKIYEYANSLGFHVDHIVPLKHKLVCGLHVPWNLQPLSPSENVKKHNKFIIE